MTDLHLIVGLGNPGRKYENTRHNVGWFVLDELAQRHRLRFDRTEKKALTARGTIAGKAVLLVKPQTYMNLSGESVRGLVDFYRIPIENVVLIHDDMDTSLGHLRLRKTGGAGGQKGVRSTIQHLKTQDFSRIRFGIDRPPGRMDPAAYVLQAFRGDDALLAREVAERAADAVELWLREGIDKAMSRYNGHIHEPPPEPEPDPEEELALCLRARELNPTDPKPLERMIGVLKRMGRAEEAAQRHAEAADLYLAAGRQGQAITHRERAASIQPDWFAMHRQLAADYLAVGNKKKAVARYLLLADRLRAAGDESGAREAVESALAINPQHPRAIEMQTELSGQG